MRYPYMPAGAFVCAFLVLVPLPSFVRLQNAAAVSMVAWLFTLNIIYAVDALVRAGNDAIHAPVWCDIVTKLMIGSLTAIPASAFCICKHLESVASGRAKSATSADHQRRTLFEIMFCSGVPIFFMALHCIVQSHRFDIVEDFGCQPAIYVSVPAIVLVWFPPLLLSVIALIYAALALHHFLRTRLSFDAALHSTNSAFTTHQYLRLMAMATTQAVWGASSAALDLSTRIAQGLRPWRGWSTLHAEWQRIDRYALEGLPPPARSALFVLWWAVPAMALTLAAYCAFARESRAEYRRAGEWAAARVRVLLRRRRRPSVLDLWPDAEGGTRRIVIHKHSTVDVLKDRASLALALPPYSPAATSFYTAEDADSKGGGSTPATPTPSTVRVAPPRPASLRSSCTSFSMSILDDYPGSLPPSPPALARPSPPCRGASLVAHNGTCMADPVSRGEGPGVVQDATRASAGVDAQNAV